MKRWLITLAIVLALAGSATAWFRMRRVQAATDLPTAPARKGEFLVIVRCRGELVAHHSVLVTAPLNVPDLQIVWLAPPGSNVTAGQPIIRFDPSTAKQQMNEHTASLHSAQANLDQAVAQARITVEQDRLDTAKARFDMEKAQLEASKQAIVSEIQGDESKIDAKVAEEKLHVQEAANELHKKSDEAKIASLTRLRDQEQRELEITKAELEEMEVKSPITGVVTFLSNTSQGWMNAQPFKVGDHAFPGASIAEIPDLATIQMEGKVDEVDRGLIHSGDAALVHIDAFPEKTFNAKLVAISPLTEMAFEWPPTRSFRSYAAIEPPDTRLRPGMNSSTDIVISRIPNAISIPAKALFTDKGKPIVYVKAKSGYEQKKVTVEARNPDEVAIKGVDTGAFVTLVEPPKEGAKP